MIYTLPQNALQSISTLTITYDMIQMKNSFYLNLVIKALKKYVSTV